MVLSIDTSRRVTGHTALVALVAAIECADPTDEDEFIEWKSSLDLTMAKGCFHVARAILGFANRDPGVAQRHFEGCGYLVVGIEPTSVAGVAVVDPADLAARVDQYVGGADGPGWDARFVRHAGVDVLIVAVEPPRAGDPLWPLRKTFDSSKDGTIFVRRKGSTAPADSADISMLTRRTRTGEALDFELDCRFEPDTAIERLDVHGYLARIHRKVEEEAEAMRTEAKGAVAKRERKPAARMKDGVLGIDTEAFAPLMHGLAGLGLDRSEPDTRTLNDYFAEVDRYVAAVDKWASSNWKAAAWERVSDVHLEVTNLTDTYLKRLRVELRFMDDRVIVLDDQPRHVDRPSRPRKFGEPKVIPSAFSRSIDLGKDIPFLPALSGSASPYVSDTWVADDGHLVFSVGDLRPRGRATSDPVRILVPLDVPGGTSIATIGAATAEGHHRVVEIHASVEVA